MMMRTAGAGLMAMTMLLLGGCATPEQRAAQQANEAAKVPAATPTGAAVDCIQTNRIRNTDVRNDSVIDFEMDGGQVYRNQLPYACGSLGSEQRFSYTVQTGQLCSVDTITVLYASPPGHGATCGLGQFQPVKLDKR